MVRHGGRPRRTPGRGSGRGQGPRSADLFSHARTVLERFVENRPYDAEGLHRLGVACTALGEREKARGLFERCIEAARTAPDHRQREVRPWRREAERELRRL